MVGKRKNSKGVVSKIVGKLGKYFVLEVKWRNCFKEWVVVLLLYYVDMFWEVELDDDRE